MDIENSEYILKLIAASSIYDLIIISLLILPILLGAWSSVIDTFLVIKPKYKKLTLILLLLIYVFGVLLSKYHGNKMQIANRQLAQVISYICDKENGASAASYEQVRNNLGEQFTNDLLDALIENSSGGLIHKKFTGNAPGIKAKCKTS